MSVVPVAVAALEDRLRITEIFHSLQGEARSVGWPTVFIRLTGCPLRCTYCDTTYAFGGGHWLSLKAILERVASFSARYVCVTGGEPLSQKVCLTLLQHLCDAGYEVSLETSGALDISEVDARVSRILDLKTPASNEMHRNRWENISLLTRHDQIKFVICNRADYEWARNSVRERRLHENCDVLLSPSFAQMPAQELAEWILADLLPVRFQMQIHKYIWGEEKGR